MSFTEIQLIELPDDSLLKRYKLDGRFTDCYAVTLDGAVTFEEYVQAFYSTPIFKIERFLLKHFAGYPSTDDGARQLANSETDKFAAWFVEERSATQLLLCDVSKRTRSWLMIVNDAGPGHGARLLFGSALVPTKTPETGRTRPEYLFKLLLGFHKIYSKVLLNSAMNKLK